MTTKGLITRIFSLVNSRLKALGFEKGEYGVLTKRMSTDTIGWIGLNKAVYGSIKVVGINPVVGVRNQKIEKLVAELCDETYNEISPPTICGNVGYIGPADSYESFAFSEEVPHEQVADQLVSAIERHGLSFMERNCEMSALVNSMQTSRFAIREVVCYRIPVALFLLGKHLEARASLIETLAVIGQRTDPAALRFKLFARRLTEQLKNKTGVT